MANRPITSSSRTAAPTANPRSSDSVYHRGHGATTTTSQRVLSSRFPGWHEPFLSPGVIRSGGKGLREKLKEYPQLRLANEGADGFYGGTVSLEPVKVDLRRVLAELAARNVRVAGGAESIRVATHNFTQPTEPNTFFDAVDRGLRGRAAGGGPTADSSSG